MAMIDSIRRRGWLVILFVAVALILFLVPPNSFGALFGRGTNPNRGKVDGKVLTEMEWRNLLQNRQRHFSYAGNSQGLSDDVWNDFIQKSLLEDDYQELGITVTEEEYEGVTFGEDLSTFVKSSFYQGMDSLPMKQQLRKNFEQMALTDPEGFALYRDMIESRRNKEKYDALVKKGIYANHIDGKWAYKMKNEKVSVQYVVKKYDEIADSTVVYSKSDLMSYYNKHKNDKDWEQEGSRNLEYVSIPVKPTLADSTALKTELSQLAAEWATASNDSLFVISHQVVPVYSKLGYQDGDFVGPENARIMNDSIGSILGPYADQNNLRIVKILKRGNKTVVDSARVRHILLSNGNGNKPMAPLRAKADSLKKIIEKNNNFEEMVVQYSEDPGSKDKGGVYDWFKSGKMVAPFEKAAFEGKFGQLEIVETTYGVHIVEPLERREHQVPEATLAAVDREIKPSKATSDQAYNDANNFSINYSDTASFRQAVDTSSTLKLMQAPNVKPNSPNIPGLKEAYPVVGWAFKKETQVGEVSQPFLIDGQWIIAVLTEIKEKGVPSFENVEEKVTKEVIKEKKAETLLEKLETANNLEEAAKALETTVKVADNLMLSSNNIPGSTVSSQKEFEVIGLAFGIAQGKMSVPIKGDGGVYMLAPSSAIVPGEPKEIFVEEQEQVMNTLKNRAVIGIFNSMKENANIKDMRMD